MNDIGVVASSSIGRKDGREHAVGHVKHNNHHSPSDKHDERVDGTCETWLRRSFEDR